MPFSLPGLSLYNYGFYWALQYAFIDCASRSERKRNTLLNEYCILYQCLKNTNTLCENLIFNAWQTSQLVFVPSVLSDNHRCTDKTICKKLIALANFTDFNLFIAGF